MRTMGKYIIIASILILFLCPIISQSICLDYVQDTHVLESPKEEPAFSEELIERSQYGFYENIGQIKDDAILFYGETSSWMIGFYIGKILVQNSNSFEIFEIIFEDSLAPKPSGTSEFNCETDFFLGDRGTFKDVRAYREIHYRNAWPGIDIVFTISKIGINYSFAIEPFSDPSNIRFGYNLKEFEDKIKIEDYISPINRLEAFQDENSVVAKWFNRGDYQYAVDIDRYDNSKEIELHSLLVESEPVIFSTYMGASSDDRAACIETNSDGDLIVYIYTNSLSFPRAPQSIGEPSGAGDCIVFKMSPNGESLLARVFIGGTGVEYPMGLAIDDIDDIYISGHTSSVDFTYNVTPYNGGPHDAFIAKLTADLSGIYWLSYVGGSGDEDGWSINVDDFGNVYMTGATNSTDFNTTNSFDNTANGLKDAFMVKLSSEGTILYSSYLGGEADDIGKYIIIGDDNHAYIVGETTSQGFPVYPESGCFDNSHNGGSDCFITKVSPAGDELIFSTFIGGIGNDQGVVCALDNSNNLYCAGNSFSQYLTDNPLFQYNGFRDGFVVKLASSGDELLFSTFIGGSDQDLIYDMDLDASGNVYISGTTYSEDYPILYGLDSHQGERDCFITKLTADGNSLCYSMIFGGSGIDDALGITIDSMNNAYVTGMTSSLDFPTSNARYSSYAGGDWDCFISGFRDMGDGDGDGLRDFQEAELGTDPYSNDTDSDGIPDPWEVENGLNATEDDAQLDPDVDGLVNLDEYYQNTDPFDLDSDNDGYSDGWEVLYSFDPNDSEVSIAQVLVSNIPIIILAVVCVVAVIVVRLLLPKLKEREVKSRKRASEEERRKALEELMEKERDIDANIQE